MGVQRRMCAGREAEVEWREQERGQDGYYRKDRLGGRTERGLPLLAHTPLQNLELNPLLWSLSIALLSETHW